MMTLIVKQPPLILTHNHSAPCGKGFCRRRVFVDRGTREMAGRAQGRRLQTAPAPKLCHDGRAEDAVLGEPHSRLNLIKTHDSVPPLLDEHPPRKAGGAGRLPPLTRANAHRCCRLSLVTSKSLELRVCLLETACFPCSHGNQAVTNKGDKELQLIRQPAYQSVTDEFNVFHKE